MTETYNIQTIVRNLNQPPHNLKLTLVEFDEKSPIKLLQILLDVLTSIESNAHRNPEGREQETIKLNVRSYFHNSSAIEAEILPLLDLLGYHPHRNQVNDTSALHTVSVPTLDSSIVNLTSDELGMLTDNIAAGDKDTIYPILEFCLSKQKELKERLYLAPFITPIQVPLDVTMTQRGDALSNLTQRYQSLQEEFKCFYEEYKQMKESNEADSAKESQYDLRTLQDEKVQLMERIGRMEEEASKNNELYRLFELTKELRQCQDDEIRLQSKCPEQKKSLESGRVKLKNLQSRYEAINALISNDEEGSSADTILNEIRKEVSSMTISVRSDLVSQKTDIEMKIAKLEGANNRPLCTEEELEGLIEMRRGLQEEYEAESSCLSEEQNKTSHARIAIFKKHAKVSASKLKLKRIDVKKKQDQLDAMKKRVKQAETALGLYLETINHGKCNENGSQTRDAEIELPDGSRIPGADGKLFLDSCHEKFKQRDEVESKISKLQSENLILERTMDVLYRRHNNIEEFLKKQEENAGVKGFHATHEKILDTDKRAEEVNKMKGETLQEVSDLVTEMTTKLKRDREKLQPMIKSLKTFRAEFQSIKQTHDQKKGRYDKLAHKLGAERHHLDKDCDRGQTEWLQLERDYHYLLNVLEVAKVNLKKVRMEEKWQNGEEKMLPDFKCLHDLYDHKLVQQEHLAKQLRIEQRIIKEGESENIKQGLLRLKKKLKDKEYIERDISQDDSLSDQITIGNSTQILSF